MRPKITRRKTAEVLPPVSGENRKGNDLVSVLTDDNRIALYDEKTGVFVRYADQKVTPYSPYNMEKANSFIEHMAAGIPLKRSLKEAGVSYTSYLHWMRKEESFRGMVNTARENRSLLMHEDFYEKDMASLGRLTSDIESLTEDEINTISKRLGLVKQKQKILKEFQEVDAPNRFGKSVTTKEAHSQVALKIDIDIPDGIKRLVDDRFRPSLNEEGEFEVKGVGLHELAGGQDSEAEGNTGSK